MVSVCKLGVGLTLLQVSVMLCTAQTLFGLSEGHVLKQRGGVGRRRRGIRIDVLLRWWDRFHLLFLLAVCTFLRALLLHLVRLGRQRGLYDDGGHLSELLPAGRLSGHDGLGAVHPGRRLTVQISTALLPASQLSEVLLLNVSLRHRQLYDLKHRDRMNVNRV